MKEGDVFSFSKAYSDRFTTFFSKYQVRRSRFTATGQKAQGGTSIRTAMQILRMEGAAGEMGRFHPVRSDMGSICMHATGILVPSQTAGSMVAEIRRENPSTFWLTGTSIPVISLYILFTIPGISIRYGDVAEPTAIMKHSLWWRHAVLYRHCLENYPRLTAIVRDTLQEEFLVGEAQIAAQGGSYSSALDRFSSNCLQKTREAITSWEAKVRAMKVASAPFAPIYCCHW